MASLSGYVAIQRMSALEGAMAWVGTSFQVAQPSVLCRRPDGPVAYSLTSVERPSLWTTTLMPRASRLHTLQVAPRSVLCEMPPAPRAYIAEGFAGSGARLYASEGSAPIAAQPSPVWAWANASPPPAHRMSASNTSKLRVVESLSVIRSFQTMEDGRCRPSSIVHR